ncbi:MAG: UDP-N-acetylmuramoyl-L-alanyl-D-glutamate--2,6-diaminopimelate ligase [Rhodospirillaceae bacterium]|jgi:UDP-N-acetylmuramoyl-L-alanyl-D-glutamate--2,6-diaminopimelate ligase|nr:UDP-N-acetylmuramoyl-L-alanyl-D-glutamate--2,6-diaminopimelate ligase [Rhodospirillaceae bacterium]MBT6405084.1 UDP-N-acetylmuramoyl-L-alanyl-D-glutamate--2,6-diaminopimelate ligase [Rhodospirillaceae bacterium]MBT6536669.1 UDP-N-acetylmuramoyl-L-alanyl-D-glutamate--2,6-diaminopimelate ligase [Rhodospirillaceae bacterium]MBT7362498.1 UDP-N-acetylmuramoyl-L-alanyl-D-glutamate--2,6-diaminopimelate ligase [Rhodospirillaceae bacterium]
MRLIELAVDMVMVDPRMHDTEISGLTADSRQVQPGYLFAALPSASANSGTDGRDFIDDAVARGAVAILAPDGTRIDGLPADTPDDTPYLITDENPRWRLSQFAARFYEHQPRHIVGVTGTNGKSSVAGFTRQIWALMGHRSGAIGTLGVDADGFDAGPSLTTPDPVNLHATLAKMATSGINHLALEASSHGLDQFRLDGVQFSAAAFTNLSRDHLDYHGTEEAYLDAKMRLFRHLLPVDGAAVLNADSHHFDTVAEICRATGHRVRSYGVQTSDIHIADVSALPDGLRLCVTVKDQSLETRLNLIGGFQAYNVLAALGLVAETGGDLTEAFATLAHLTGVRGRMQRIGALENSAQVYVDYAHTPDALQTALDAIRPHVGGQLHLIFGAGGDRDPGKRPMMGEVATRHADSVIVTDDNPRREDPQTIRRQIMTGCTGANEIGDRAAAIKAGISSLQDGDILVIAGKGHEQGQIIGTETLPFDDASIAADILTAMGGEVVT